MMKEGFFFPFFCLRESKRKKVYRLTALPNLLALGIANVEKKNQRKRYQTNCDSVTCLYRVGCEAVNASFVHRPSQRSQSRGIPKKEAAVTMMELKKKKRGV